MSIHHPKKNETIKERHRDAITGRFVTVQKTKDNPDTTIKEKYIAKPRNIK